jgi:hypothetical protein
MVAVGVCVGRGVDVLVGVGVKVPVWVDIGAGDVKEPGVGTSIELGACVGSEHAVNRVAVRMKSRKGYLNFRKEFVRWCNSKGVSDQIIQGG